MPGLMSKAAGLWKKLDLQARRFEKQFELRGQRSPFRRDKPLSKKLSIVSAMHNVAPYLDEYLASVTSQSTGLRNVEIILVNDGSTDDTGTIAKHWMARFPEHIRYVEQANQGVAAARNAGLALATGDWITFPDPDDFLSRNYFATINREISRAHTQPLLMISLRLIFYREATGARADRHPLRHRYERARTELSSWDLGEFIQLSASTACFDRHAIVRHGLKFDSAIKPTFEDGHFVNRLILHEPRRSVVFSRGATYYYRKRSNQSSALDGSHQSPAWFTDQFRHGYLALIEEALDQVGYVPKFIQTTLLYEIFWRFKHLLGHDYRADVMTSEQKDEFVSLLERVLQHIDKDVIESHSLGNLHEEHKKALLGAFKGLNRSTETAYIRAVDMSPGGALISHITATDQKATASVNGADVEPLFPKTRKATFLGKPYYTENRFWIPASSGDEISVKVDGQTANLKIGRRTVGETITLRRAHEQLVPGPVRQNGRSRSLRNYACSPSSRTRFSKCWVFMDRDDAADDNAEHLYRYVSRSGQPGTLVFILRPSSPDWDRLANEGFNLIEFGSKDHAAALVNAEFLISSHADEFIMWPFPKAWLADLVSYQYVFLQHGVTLNDVSHWLNTKPIRLLVTSTRDEYRAITSTSSNYVFSTKEVKLTGMPRHDALGSIDAPVEKIMIMPTWRRSLMGETIGDGMQREKNPLFYESGFCAAWRSVLQSAEVRDLAERHGKQVLFCPHPNLSLYIDDFEVPGYIEVRHPAHPPSLQTSVAQSAVLITDYSSIAFEAAFLNRAVVYYQFDRNTFFASGHFFRAGYFDFERDGFGAVCLTEDAVIASLKAVLEDAELQDYKERRVNTFPYRDGSACRRVHEAILQLRPIRKQWGLTA